MEHLILRSGAQNILSTYIASQLSNMFPHVGVEDDKNKINEILPYALDRIRPIVNSIRNFTPGYFDHLNSLQYSTLLYILANVEYLENDNSILADRLFCLNRALNSIDLFYTVKMPEVFFLSHGIGTVLGNAQYDEDLVVFQNVTVGRVGDNKPCIGRNVVLYPGAVVTGKSIIGNNCVVSANVLVQDTIVPDNTIVLKSGSELIFKPRKRDFRSLYFRNSI